MGRKTKDATELQPGDQIRTGRDRTERVAAPSTRGSHGTVTVHTDDRDITTTLPCPVTVKGGR